MTGTILDQLRMPPSAALLGWRFLDYDRETGWIRVAFDGKREFLNPAGFIQGGIQAAMLDDTMGPALWLASEGRCYPATIEMNLQFLSPARPGMIVGEASVTRMGGAIGFLEGRLLDGEGRLLSRATASARLMEPARSVGESYVPPRAAANDSSVLQAP